MAGGRRGTAAGQNEFLERRQVFVERIQHRLEPIDMRLYLRIDGRALTETWIYLWTPPNAKERKAALS